MKYWFVNAVCGVLVLILLGMHMSTVYLDDLFSAIFGRDLDPLGWDEVSSRGASGFITATYVVFLGTALFHGLYGLHTVLTEFWTGRRAARLALVGCWAAGILLFLVGTIATVSFYLLNQA